MLFLWIVYVTEKRAVGGICSFRQEKIIKDLWKCVCLFLPGIKDRRLSCWNIVSELILYGNLYTDLKGWALLSDLKFLFCKESLSRISYICLYNKLFKSRNSFMPISLHVNIHMHLKELGPTNIHSITACRIEEVVWGPYHYILNNYLTVPSFPMLPDDWCF